MARSYFLFVLLCLALVPLALSKKICVEVPDDDLPDFASPAPSPATAPAPAHTRKRPSPPARSPITSPSPSPTPSPAPSFDDNDDDDIDFFPSARSPYMNAPAPAPSSPAPLSGYTSLSPSPSPSPSDSPSPSPAPSSEFGSPESCSVKYWANNPNLWPVSLGIKRFSTVKDIFGAHVAGFYPPTMTFMEALRANGAHSPYAPLIRQAAAALLNSKARKNFPYTTEDVKNRLAVNIGRRREATEQAVDFARANANNPFGTRTQFCI